MSSKDSTTSVTLVVVPEIEIRVSRYSHPDAQLLTDEVQLEYVRRYGGGDDGPIDQAEFDAPNGAFLIAYRAGSPVGMGGWRLLGAGQSETAWADPAAEVKRMYVVPAARGLGLARRILSELEAGAAAAGASWLLLETGDKQPEAIRLYESSGFRPVPSFGHYGTEHGSIHLGKQLGAQR
jgi:GNAT superfamily N-acetyltransferase